MAGFLPGPAVRPVGLHERRRRFCLNLEDLDEQLRMNREADADRRTGAEMSVWKESRNDFTLYEAITGVHVATRVRCFGLLHLVIRGGLD
jgi:hypothetical protein